jgi:hypothetical protein
MSMLAVPSTSSTFVFDHLGLDLPIFISAHLLAVDKAHLILHVLKTSPHRLTLRQGLDTPGANGSLRNFVKKLQNTQM